eukprot:COSAG01_NODE_2695_length_7242_cov_4.051519_3_plen_110_part_00
MIPLIPYGFPPASVRPKPTLWSSVQTIGGPERWGGGDSAPQRDEACVPQPIQQLLRAAPAGRWVESLDPVHPVLGLDGASLIDVPVQMPQPCVHARTPSSDRRGQPPSG